jgi:hypothetical protein
VNNIIPNTIVDGFFDDPYQIREFGLQSAQHTETDRNQVSYRGQRSECLSKVHPVLFDQINKKILSSFYDLSKENILIECLYLILVIFIVQIVSLEILERLVD